ncbi:hypothetical protein [Kribbella sp. NPDC004536]|uniref:hypothetical protein n=1 Tax=Kribbella sp. NPDC004536 TaxID=3364106 RepID=UPI00369979A9
MSDPNAYGKLSYGRTTPGERQARVRKNPELQAIPAKDRLLTINCSATRGNQPFLLAVVTWDEVLTDWSANGTQLPAAGRNHIRCGCAAVSHEIDLSKVYEALDRLRHQSQKARVVDVEAFLYR